MNILGIEFLTFGNVTILLCIITLLVLLLSGIIEAGITSLKILLAADHEDAPEYGFNNIIWSWVQAVFVKDEYNLVRPSCNGDHSFIYTSDGENWHSRSSYGVDINFRMSYKEAEKLSLSKYPNISNEEREVFIVKAPSKIKVDLITTILGGSLCLDLLFLGLITFFFPTVILSSMVLFVYGVRTIAKKVYANSAKIKDHKTRIETLESDKENK